MAKTTTDEKTSRFRAAKAVAHRLKRQRADYSRGLPQTDGADPAEEGAQVDCGWGRLLFAQTFKDPAQLVSALREEAPDRRDIAVYVADPHVVLAAAPQELFLDPSHTYRLDLATYRSGRRQPRGFFVRRLSSEVDADAVNRIYASRGMVPVRPDFFWSNRDNRSITYLVAEDDTTGEVIGTVTGVDHRRAFNDTERGSSLWCLAVDPQARHAGIGEALVRRLGEHFKARGAAFMDLSVLHDNEQAIGLYEKLHFRRITAFAVKRKNSINERLYANPLEEYDVLNPYARLIVDEARRRGIHVDITDAEGGFFRLTQGGRSVHCRESLSELTSGVAMSICDDKAVTRRVVERAGLVVPEQMTATDDETLLPAFLEKHGRVVVKPARGEQGRAVAVGIDELGAAKRAIAEAREVCDRVLVEACFEGEDLRLVVIDFKLVAAAVRRPPHVIGDGKRTVRDLIQALSRRRAAATGGESTIPIDAETERCLKLDGLTLDSVLENGREVMVRKAANLHTGGSIHDVTGIVHPKLVEAAITAARAINIPVVGIDFMVRSATEPDYVFIEANERPGLANHEPQPTAERFLDLLFPTSGHRAANLALGKM
ncbi:N-acetylglutaminylglutamine synthetase [Pseudorhizobium endolithicum]|uniref:N-acetylglutaminylglutamine synthetase n=1 Tax=Pseudorhizobium endolithicum TaxID=1191678 RepID=A0ABM8PY52_9HYPH|nr:N-acetylglutaminylglutamine synthetase [Pseudorhizobium endolithicum]CAD7054508.1 N-acetylglutaminylglutamine synthetase [Pseudorhizobium endolithicum]